jgi:hypothetical protein
MGQRRLQLGQIKDELRFPFLDPRRPFHGLSEDKVFQIVTGTTKPDSTESMERVYYVLPGVSSHDDRVRLSSKKLRSSDPVGPMQGCRCRAFGPASA